MNSFQLRQYALLFITAVIWGSGFIGQRLGMDHVSPYTFTFMRTFIGGLFLIPVILLRKRILLRLGKKAQKSSPKMLLWGSILCGSCLIAAESFQQFGMIYTDVSKASFITSLYVIFVPLISVFIGSRPSLKIWLCTLAAACGRSLLCIKDELSLAAGDSLVLICAVIFAVHIMVIAYFVRFCDGVELSCGQFFVASALGLILMLISGTDSAEDFMAAAPAFIYCGIMSNGVAYTLQIVGQRGVNPVIATIILSLESVMGTIFGVTLLGDALTSRQLLGCALMFAAVVSSQIPVALLLRSALPIFRHSSDNDKIMR